MVRKKPMRLFMTDANQLSTSLGHPNWTLPWQIEPLVHFFAHDPET